MATSCKTCHFLGRHDEVYVCRRLPPAPTDQLENAWWPRVDAETDWCGDHLEARMTVPSP